MRGTTARRRHEQVPPVPLGRHRVRVVFGALVLVTLLGTLDSTMVATALPTIAGDLGDFTALSWVGTAYLLALPAIMPLAGKMIDRIGVRPVLLVSVMVFLAGSAGCGLAQSMTMLAVCRAIQGGGAGGMMIACQVVVPSIVAPRELGRYMGLLGGVYGVSSFLGPLVGGLFVDHWSWRWAFLINVPLGVLALGVTAAGLRRPAQRLVERPRIDLLGAILLTAAVACVVLVASWGGVEYGWISVPILSLVVAAVVLLVGWFVAQWWTEDPLLPVRLFRRNVFSTAGAVSFVVGFAMYASVAYLPTFLQIVDGASATSSGLLLLPLMAGSLAGSLGSGHLISRWGRYKLFPVVGTALSAVALLLLSTVGVATTRVETGVYMALLGLGIGLVLQVVTVAVQHDADPADLGVATSSVNFLRQVGATIGIAAGGAIFTSHLGSFLASSGRPELGVRARSLTPEVLRSLPADDRAVLVHGVADALPMIFAYMAPMLVAAFVLALIMRDKQNGAAPSAGRDFS